MFLVALLTLLLAAPALGQIETDSPSLANSSKTVGDGVFQWESGALHFLPRGRLARSGRRRFQRSELDEAEAPYTSTPNLFRLGVSPDLELRIESETLAWQGSTRAFSDVSLGFKWTALQGDEVSLGLIGMLTPPSGAATFRNRRFSPSLILASDFQLSSNQSLTLNLGGALNDHPRRGSQVIESFGALCYNLDWNERWLSYVEMAVSGPDDDSEIFETILDAGIGYRPTPDTIINLSYFRGLSSQGLDWGVALSFGIRP